ncbi:DUF1524 domain-containing protein [Blastococcus sp. LR1]|uniref:GmrSD restriction endonuclease domain-containing protein n=1 Tax=Blastococcus sp. LR1 TaxID=2877000 RepID=UPI001CCD8AD7|nr:DUF1524 domain-containing protein [Blastococcus sp. LR1]MCA0146260.1 DUF1524 domain-containing protein [Blastococcus sp. LR1]
MSAVPIAGRRAVLAGVAVLALFIVVGGAAAGGLPGVLVMAGLIALLVGVVAALRGHARWAFIGTRRVAGIVAAAGLVAVLVGGATMPPTEPVASTSEEQGQETAELAEPTLSAAELEAAEAAADAALAEAETAEAAVEADRIASAAGVLNQTSADAVVGSASATSALAALAALEVKGRAPRTGYDRDLFGSGWVDTDRNGCDTRNDMLTRDLTGETYKPGTRSCVVLTGSLADPYSGRQIAFTRGQGTSEAVQIDHVVALSDAWQKGAQGWDTATRVRFANDPLNLLAVDGPLNMQKGDGDAATWLPPATAYRCAYVARQVAVKVSYKAWVTQAEKNTMATVLASCPGETLPGGVVAALPERAPAPAPTPRATAAPRPAPAPAPAPRPIPAPVPAPVAPAPAPVPPPSSVYYKNCDAARAAGAAPIRQGQPGYGTHLDRDKDGIGCDK